jgi:predicted  nucleic acid-binding Zn-ribbon protein
MSSSTDGILAALGRLETGQHQAGLQATMLRDRVTTLGDQFTTLGDQFTMLGDRVTTLGDQLTTRLDQLTTRLDQLTTRLDQLTTRQDRSETVQIQTRADVMARMDRLQDILTGMRDDLLVNFGTADQVRRAHDSTREELRTVNEMVSLLVTKIRLLESDVRTLKGEP